MRAWSVNHPFIPFLFSFLNFILLPLFFKIFMELRFAQVDGTKTCSFTPMILIKMDFQRGQVRLIISAPICSKRPGFSHPIGPCMFYKREENGPIRVRVLQGICARQKEQMDK